MSTTKEPSILGEIARQCVADSDKWFGDQPAAQSVPHHTLAMCGEVGEFANIIKKLDRGSLNLNDAKVRYDLAMEAADVFIYLMNLCGLLHIDMFYAYTEKRRINDARFTEQRGERESRNG